MPMQRGMNFSIRWKRQAGELMGGKKDRERFCIKFNENDPAHDAVIRLLEKQGPRSKAQFLVNAVLHYINCPETPDIAIPQTVDRAAIVCDGCPFCGKGELRPGLTAGADRAAFDRVLEEFCRRVLGTVTVSYEQTDRQ